MKIYITGCAHSGTTLLRRLFYYFGIKVVNKEITPKDFRKLKGPIVGKRTHNAPLAGFNTKFEEIEDFTVICCVRNGPDTIETGYVKPDRWMCATQAFLDNQSKVIPVFYETLVTNPDIIGENLKTSLGLSLERPFSSYPQGLPPEAFSEHARVKGYSPRPIAPDKVGKAWDYSFVSEEFLELDRILKGQRLV